MSLRTAGFVVGVWLIATITPAPGFADWPMLGANPQRTSWVPDEVRGNVTPVWYRPIEPYINYKIQVIAADGKLFISTARGLYGLDADTGAVLWVYPTKAPLGHSPTYYAGRLYVGSYDRTIHCVDAVTGRKVEGWVPHVALAGFETNPIVFDGRVYAGNRDGYFYCLDAQSGALVWRFKTGGPIRFSAAMDAQRVIYFASQDMHAYALRDAGTAGQLVWKSSKLLGDSFTVYWPVVYRDWVLFSGSNADFPVPPYGDHYNLIQDDRQADADLTQNMGNEPGDWAPGTVTMDASRLLEYYESKPHRRRVFMLSRTDGREYTLDTDADGRPEYIPFTFAGVTRSGSKYPPVVGADGVLYGYTALLANNTNWTAVGAIAGWKVGTKYLSRVMDWGVKSMQAADEPMAFSIGGRVVYWSLCCDREAGAFDLSVPFGQPNRFWAYWGYTERFSKFPDYEPMYFGDGGDGWGTYGEARGVYGKHGAQNPWVPYNGKLYRQMGNAIVAVAPGGTATRPLPMAPTVAVTDAVPAPPHAELRARLDEEIDKMIAAGHLKPGLFVTNGGDWALAGNGRSELDQGVYYYSSPGDTIYALVRALPHLSQAMQTRARAYIQSEMAAFPLDTYAYVGHIEGTPRQAGSIRPEFEANFQIPKQTDVVNGVPWRFPMMAFYAAWQYAKVSPTEAGRLYANLRPKLTVPPVLTDSQLVNGLQALNAYLAGYLGFLELERMAGQPESVNVRSEYQRLLNLRLANVSGDAPWNGVWGGPFDFLRGFIWARHFLYLVPEVGRELRAAKRAEVQALVDRIDSTTPYWFVAGYDATYMEGTHQHLYDVATFNAHSMVLQTPWPELLRYLDAPVFPVGDLDYIHRLVSVIEAAAGAPAVPTGVRVVQ